MKATLKEDKGLYRELTLEVEGAEVKRALDEIYQYLSHTATLPGFRKGKIPRKILRKRFGDTIKEHVAKVILDNYLEKALEEKGVKPIADVFLTEVKINEEKPSATVVVRFEVPPQIELKDLEEITVEVPKLEFSQEQVENYINQLREQNAQWNPVDREIRKGDLVEVEYEITDTESGEKERGETSAVIGDGLFRKEIEEALEGKKAGEEIELKELPIYDQEGKEVGKVNIKLKIKGVKEKVLPELNDEFAKKLNLGETWEEARKKIEEQLKEQFERSKEQQKLEKLLLKLVEVHKFDIPESLVRRESDILFERRLQELSAYGINPNQVDREKLLNEILPTAVFNVASRLLLDRLADKLNIEVGEEEVNREIEKLAKAYNISPQELKKSLQDRGLIEMIKADLRRNKALEEASKRVKFVEVEPKEEKKGGKKDENKEGENH
ncbi:MAG TPA: trigger factor [Aquifex aeolicus]|nr:trigger factor [Aquificales bacterium]HIQ25814.1 trigger factor [Aquifex aeolicus]